MQEETAAFPDLSDLEFFMTILHSCCDKLRLPDKFAKLLDGRAPRGEVTLREAGGGRRLWDVEVVSDGEGHVYLERGWEQFARAHDLGLGNVLVFGYDDGDAVLTVKVFDDANTRSGSSSDSGHGRNRSSSTEIGIGDTPRSQFTVTLKKCHSGVSQQQYPVRH